MKTKSAIIFSSALVLLSIWGCPGPNGRRPGKALLPPDVAGTWQARGSQWKIVVEPDATLASAVIDMGTVEVKPNKTAKVEMKDGSFSTYTAGECPVEYNPDTRELFVTVEVEEMHIRFMDNAIDGNSVDRFMGPVSEDGKEWTADWIKVFDYGPRFPQGPNDIAARPLIFDKVED